MMKKFFFFLGIILLLAVFQTSLLAPWFPNYLYPDLLLAALVCAAIIFGFRAVWGWTILAGAILDLLAYTRVGTHVIIFILAVYAVSFVSRRFSIGDRGMGIVFVMMLMPFITAFEYWGVPWLNGIDLNDKWLTLQAFGSIGIITLENIVLFLVFYPALLKIKKYYSPFQYRMVK